MPTLATTSSSIHRDNPVERSAATSPVRACDALERLQADQLAQQAPSPLLSVVLAVLTLGAGPAILWTWRFRTAARQEREVLCCLSEWAASHIRDPGARRKLQKPLGCVRLRLLPAVGCVLFAAAALVLTLASVLIIPNHAEPSQIWMGSTYGFHWPRYNDPEWFYLRWRVFAGWTGCLFTSYLLHLATVHLFSHDVQRYLDAFNQQVAVEEGFAPVLLEPIGWKSSPVWGLTSAALMTVSSWWGIPLAVAGMTDARYRRRASCRMREALGDRVRSLIHLRPAYHDAPTVDVVRTPVMHCATPGCNTPLAANAKFCVRCGARRGKAIDRRA